jgi:hypothetical protein
LTARRALILKSLITEILRQMPAIPIIDVLAGPGGPGEGFSFFSDATGSNAFRISLSIEKERGSGGPLASGRFGVVWPKLDGSTFASGCCAARCRVMHSTRRLPFSRLRVMPEGYS